MIQYDSEINGIPLSVMDIIHNNRFLERPFTIIEILERKGADGATAYILLINFETMPGPRICLFPRWLMMASKLNDESNVIGIRYHFTKGANGECRIVEQ